MPTTTGPRSILDRTMADLGLQAAEPLLRDAEQQQAAIGQQQVQPSFSSMVPGLDSLLGTGQSAQQQASPTSQPPATGWLGSLPSLQSLMGPQAQQQPTPSGTPSAMPSAPGVVPATITSGPRPGQTLRPGESVGSVTLAGGSHPDQQAMAYQEALASGLDEEGARILVAITETEGGLTGAVGDTHLNARGSRGGYQFYEGGQMPGFRSWLQQQGIQGDPDVLVNDIRLTTRYAATGYLGRAIAAGRQQGLSGAELATYVQRHGQVSVNPEKTGQNYQRLYGPGAQVYPDRGQPAVRENVPAAPLTPPQASDTRTYPERPMPAPAGSASGPKLRVRDKWGNEFELTQEQLNRRPGGYADLTILGPVAMNSGAGVSPAASAAAGPGGGRNIAGAGALPQPVMARWDQRVGSPMTDEDMAQLRALGVVA